MEYLLMNSDIPTLRFDLDEFYMEVLNNQMLPYELKDFVKTTDSSDIKKTMRDITTLKDFFISRTLNLSRENAKEILLSANMPQSSKTEERLKIVFACRGLTMTDNFWIKGIDESLKFSDVNLRAHKLSDASYDIAILGKHISVTAEELRPDLSTNGMFPKFWHREPDGIYMWKTDKSKNYINTKCEVEASKILRNNGVPTVAYTYATKDDQVFSVSKCIATEEHSIIRALSIRDWCDHTGRDFIGFLEENYLSAFADMCIADYIIANTDEHIENWHFVIDNNTNEILGLSEMFDFNHALIADYVGTDISDLIYEPTGLSFEETIKKYAADAALTFDEVLLPEKCKERLKKVEMYRCQEQSRDITDEIER